MTRSDYRAEAKPADATAYCSGEFPCEASTAAASLERQLHGAEADVRALRLGLLAARNALLDYGRVYDDKDACTDAMFATEVLAATEPKEQP
jgi:hypothetical protein